MPEYRSVEHKGDMGEELPLRIIQQDDGDVIVGIGMDHSVEFCTLQGGGRSQRTRLALRRVMDAMVADEKDPGGLVDSGGTVEELLEDVWHSLSTGSMTRENAHGYVSGMHAVGAVSDAEYDGWQNDRFNRCPGHEGEGGRVWCFYCGDIAPEESDEDED